VAFALVLLALGVGLGLFGCSEPAPKRALGSRVKAQVPRWAREQGFAGNKRALAGANLFAESGCTNCHTYLGTGNPNLGAPDLSAEGAKHRGIRFQVEHLRCPSCVHRGSPMPPFTALGATNLHRLAVFLEASKGRR
jgi:hypothetical protein